VLRRELTDVDKELSLFIANEVKPVVPDLSMVDHDDELDPVAMHCVATEGRDCHSAAAVSTERD
jgi:hypothetical protein